MQPNEIKSLHNWNPGLNNGQLALQSALDTLPGYEPKAIHFLVRFFENPDSPFHLTGAINLPRHDAVHIMLGRGTLPQDEAFVIGFTMGTSKHISRFEVALYEWLTQYIYPDEYRFSDKEIQVFELALAYGKSCAVSQLYEFPFERYLQRSIAEIRRIIGLDLHELQYIYQKERRIITDSIASKRLPLGPITES